MDLPTEKDSPATSTVPDSIKMNGNTTKTTIRPLLDIKGLSVIERATQKTLIHPLDMKLFPGQMACLVGGTNAGKSLLLRALSQRKPIDCKIQYDSHDTSLSGIRSGYVPTEDNLIGEITVLETLRYAARLAMPDEPADEREERLLELINDFGLSHVSNNVIGTLLNRGLSGGEKRRVSVLTACAAQPDVLLLDELSSGLDSASALNVVLSLKRVAAETGTVVITSLQQPSTRLLEAFDLIMVMNRGLVAYSGGVAGIAPFMSSVGLPASKDAAPIDLMAEALGSDPRAVNRCIAWRQQNPAAASALAALPCVKSEESQESTEGLASSSDKALKAIGAQRLAAQSQPQQQYSIFGFRRLVANTATLMHRFNVVAVRMLPLYWLQFLLVAGFGFLIGAVFWKLPLSIGGRIQNLPNGLVWLTYVASYIQVFRVFYLADNRNRMRSECGANRLYSVLPWTLADSSVTAIYTALAFVPGLLLALFMMDVPYSSIGFSCLLLWLTALTSESLLDLVVQLVQSTPYAVLACQGVLVLTSVFAGGAYISIDRVDHNFWVWLQDISLYNYAARAIQIYTMNRAQYQCDPSYIISSTGNSAVCQYSFYALPCVSNSVDSTGCKVNGNDVLTAVTGLRQHTDGWAWGNLLILLALLLGFRLITALLQIYEPQRRLAPSFQHFVRYISGKAENQQSNDDSDNSTVTIAFSGVSNGVSTQDSLNTTPASSSSVLTWQNVSLKLRSNDKVLVRNMTGHATSGRMLSIMGGSGAGKTTFLNALSYRAPYAKIEGQVLLNNRPLRSSDLQYVPQFDALNPSITSMESLLYSGNLYGSSNLHERAEHLLHILDMSHLAHARVETLSFGERKRLIVAMALLSDAPILALDEPTTGLDGHAAKVLVTYVRRLVTETNTVCIMTIHQPSSQLFACFDDLILLTAGCTAYFGPLNDAKTYFTELGVPLPPNCNCADFYLDLISKPPAHVNRLISIKDAESKETHTENMISSPSQEQNGLGVPSKLGSLTNVSDWYEVYINSTYAAHANAAQQSVAQSTSLTHAVVHKLPSEMSRLVFLFMFHLRYFVSERSLYIMRLVELVVIGLFIGSLWFQTPHSESNIGDIAGSLFFSTWSVLFAAISGIVIHARDRITNMNEFLNGQYRLHTLHLAQAAASLPFHFVSAIIYNIIVWFMIGYNYQGDGWINAVLTVTMLTYLMETLALTVTSILKDPMLSTTFSMVILGLFFLLAGFFIRQTDMVREIFWASYLVPSHFSLDGQLDAIFHGEMYGSLSGDEILSVFFDLNGNFELRRWVNWGIVVAFAAGFRMMYYGVQWMQYRQYKK